MVSSSFKLPPRQEVEEAPIGRLISLVPDEYNWLMRSPGSGSIRHLYYVHIFDDRHVESHQGYGVSPEEAFRKALYILEDFKDQHSVID